MCFCVRAHVKWNQGNALNAANTHGRLEINKDDVEPKIFYRFRGDDSLISRKRRLLPVFHHV